MFRKLNKQAKKFISDTGYEIDTNFTLPQVSALMARFALATMNGETEDDNYNIMWRCTRKQTMVDNKEVCFIKDKLYKQEKAIPLTLIDEQGWAHELGERMEKWFVRESKL